jgi:L-fuculose-phosphate aldolase
MLEVGRRLWLRGFVAANDGNLSVRLDDGRVLATPTGISKGFMASGDLIVTDLEGRLVEGERRPSSELQMHLEVYRGRPDVGAVVHAHPPVATAFAVAGIPLDQCLLPEMVVSLGAIPIAPYGTPSTDEIPRSIRPFVPRCDAVLLANHGAVTWADTLEGAFHRMETLEHTATITHHAMSLGRLNPLPAAEVEKLQALRARYGLTGRVLPCQAAGACPALESAGEQDQLVERVVQAVLEALGERRR